MLYSKLFHQPHDLSNFVNDNGIGRGDILKVDADPSNSGWVICWYDPPTFPGIGKISIGGSTTFQTKWGSRKGYVWSFVENNSGGSLNPKTGEYRAGSKGGVIDVIQIMDSEGSKAIGRMTVDRNIFFSPIEPRCHRGESFLMVASGGAGYGWVWSMDGNLSGGAIDAGGIYTAGDRVGTDVVRVSDALSNAATCSIFVL